jgi:hypothetical protein
MSLPADSSDLSDNFFRAWAKAFSDMGVDPMFPLKACMHESGAFAGAHNPNGNAVGLIQFVPSTLTHLGFPGTWRDMQRLRAEDQVPWVAKFYKPYAKFLKNPALCYVTTFIPSQTAPAAQSGDPAYKLCDDGNHGAKLSWAYLANPGFDVAKKGWTDVQDLANMIEHSCKGARWDSLQKRMQDAIDGKLAPTPPPVPPAMPDAIPTISGDNHVISNTAPIVEGSSLLVPGLMIGAAVLGIWFAKKGLDAYVAGKRSKEEYDEWYAKEQTDRAKLDAAIASPEYQMKDGAFIARNDGYPGLVRWTNYWKERGHPERAKYIRLGYLRERTRLMKEDPEWADRFMTRVGEGE